MKDTNYSKIEFGIDAYAIVVEKQLDTSLVRKPQGLTEKIIRKEPDGTLSSGYRKINIAEQKKNEWYKKINHAFGCSEI